MVLVSERGSDQPPSSLWRVALSDVASVSTRPFALG